MTTLAEPMTNLFAAVDPSFEAHLSAYGALPAGDGVLSLVDAAGVRGRGGAGFPTAVKMRAVLASPGDAVVVGNGAEGEPASAKDRSLLAYSPHLVLDGLQLAAAAVGASEAYLAVASGAGALEAALAKRFRIDTVPVKVVAVPHRFLIGEETALVSALGGGRGLPRGRRIPVYERGVSGRPTLVQNVETLARLALVARSSDAGSSFLATVTGAVVNSGVVDVAAGQTLSSVLDAAGGASERLSAVLLGGYHGGFVPASALDVPLTAEGLRPFGVSVGAGVVVAIPASRCGLIETARVASYLAAQSARQCGPCLNGLPALAGELALLARGRSSPTAIRGIASLVAGRGACHHPDGAVRFIGSALSVFASEVSLHAAGQCSRTSDEPLLPTPGVQ